MGYSRKENFRTPEICDDCPVVDIEDPAIYEAECDTVGGNFNDEYEFLVLADPDNPVETAVAIGGISGCRDAFCGEHENRTSASLGRVHEAVDACDGPVEWKILGKFVTSRACGAKLMPAKKHLRHFTNAKPRTMKIVSLPVVPSKGQKAERSAQGSATLSEEEVRTREEFRTLYYRTLERAGVDYLQHKKYINSKTALKMREELDDHNWQPPEQRTVDSKEDALRVGMEAGVPKCLLERIKAKDISWYLSEVTAFQRYAKYDQEIFPLLMRSIASQETVDKMKELGI